MYSFSKYITGFVFNQIFILHLTKIFKKGIFTKYNKVDRSGLPLFFLGTTAIFLTIPFMSKAHFGRNNRFPNDLIICFECLRYDVTNTTDEKWFGYSCWNLNKIHR